MIMGGSYPVLVPLHFACDISLTLKVLKQILGYLPRDTALSPELHIGGQRYWDKLFLLSHQPGILLLLPTPIESLSDTKVRPLTERLYQCIRRSSPPPNGHSTEVPRGRGDFLCKVVGVCYGHPAGHRHCERNDFVSFFSLFFFFFFGGGAYWK